MNIIGIDPGHSGGIVRLMPHLVPNYQKFSDLTEYDTLCVIRNFCTGDCVVYIEQVHSMPMQGVSSTFKFGMHYGFLRACIHSVEKPMFDVSPMKWQGALGCLTKGDKNVTKARAQQWFPSIKVTHAIADALLIAEYGRRVENAGTILR